jgi:septal ring factor EnvC (AmiA/AmiB activator)
LRRATLLLLVVVSTSVVAQTPRPDTATRRVNDRLQALQREAQQLATQSKTLLGDLRQLEIERDLRTEEAHQAEAAAAAAQQSLDTITARVATLEQQREAQLPDLRAQLVDIYKHGRSGYAQLLFGATDAREFARATRAVASLSTINERRLAEHRATIAALRTERAAQARTANELREKQQEADQARTAAQRALAARTALINRIDARRDLTAQYVGELQVAYERLQRQVTSSGAGRVEVPLAPFKGALEWPVVGRVTGRFGSVDRAGGAALSNGIEIAAPEGAVVKAVHGGTVAFAGPLSGFGTLVILDHGGNDFTLYGLLGSVALDRGAAVEAGSEVGRTGPGPGTAPGLYFEVRIDGRSVDPLQWLKPR